MSAAVRTGKGHGPVVAQEVVPQDLRYLHPLLLEQPVAAWAAQRRCR
jgi:hypothetical protein